MREENIKTAKKTAPCTRWAWFFRLIGPGKNGAETGEITLRVIYIYIHIVYILLYISGGGGGSHTPMKTA